MKTKFTLAVLLSMISLQSFAVDLVDAVIYCPENVTVKIESTKKEWGSDPKFKIKSGVGVTNLTLNFVAKVRVEQKLTCSYAASGINRALEYSVVRKIESEDISLPTTRKWTFKLRK